MKKFIAFSLVVCGVISTAVAAPSQRRGQSNAATPAAAESKTVSARAATTRTVPRAGATAATSARSAVRNTVARSATTPAAPVVKARAGTTQKVINSGTKVSSAVKNVIVSEECQQKYDGCMDSFCMLDNESGGRCLCSNRNSELDAVLAEIEKLDEQTYQMATYGVEKINLGENADDVLAQVNSVTQSFLNPQTDTQKSGRRSLDTSLWNTNVDFESDEDVFGEISMSMTSSIDGKTGDALHTAADALCVAQIPECSAELNMLQLMYGQRIKSDCSAYENSLKKRKGESQDKLNVATKALRDAALTKHQEANKYDLGQCTIEFKKCMQTTAECGSDFAKCASVAAIDTTNSRFASKAHKSYKIQGEITTIEIAASTYDSLMAKKPLCEHVTQKCVKVADNVWDTFLKEVAPTLKSAELIAEDNIRMSCMANISDCFRTACKDSIDPSDPDGSYDLCLTRPETMLNLCKVPLEACGISASNKRDLEKNEIWSLVVARLAGMRVDSCTTQIKECIQSEDRCGKDYSKCIGLDTDEIIRMCPYEKLTGCQQVYGETKIGGDEIYVQISDMIAGLITNIDNNALTTCQQALDEAMIKVCGDKTNCDAMTIDEYLGANTLDYKICGKDDSGNESCYKTVEQMPDTMFGRVYNNTKVVDGSEVVMSYNEILAQSKIANFAGQIGGEIAWEKVSYGLPTLGKNGKYTRIALNAGDDANDLVAKEIAVLNQNIQAVIDAIESDQKVKYCMQGRDISGVKRGDGNAEVIEGEARFPALTNQIQSIIATSALKRARDNYFEKFDELNEQMQQDFVKIAGRIAEEAGENELEARRNAAAEACLGYAKASALPMTKLKKNDTKNSAWYSEDDKDNESSYTATAQINNWNYKETVTTTFSEETLICRKCTRSQSCTEPKGGRKFCKEWAEVVENCVDTQF